MADDEITAEFDSASLTAPSAVGDVPLVQARLRWAARTDIGKVRDSNEDKFDVFEPENIETLARRGRLYAVADGMGGHAAGQIASEATLKWVVRRFFAPTGSESLPSALQAAVLDANRFLLQAASTNPACAGMGTTLVAAVVRGDMLTVAHAGDSRAILLRPGQPARALTTDHSWVEEQVRAGALTREQAEQSSRRNVITRCIGMDGMPGADIQTLPLQSGDIVVLASDGLTNHVDLATLARIVNDRKGLAEAALALVDCANDNGGSDNSTVLLLRCDGFDAWPGAEAISGGSG